MMVPLTYPSVKHGEERLRVNITRGHTQEDMDTALELPQDLRRGVLRAVGRGDRPDGAGLTADAGALTAP